MALPIEGFTVVAQYDRIKALLAAGAIELPNGTCLNDDHIWRCSFMAEADAKKFLSKLGEHDLNVSEGPDSDAVLVDEFERSIYPYCEWLETACWEKAVIAWKTGTSPKTLIAPKVL